MEEDDVDVTITPTSKNVYNNDFHVDSRPKILIDLTASSGLRSSITRTKPVLPEMVQPQVQPLREHNQCSNSSQQLDPEMDTLVNDLIKNSGMHFCTVYQKGFKRHKKSHDDNNLNSVINVKKSFIVINYTLKRHTNMTHTIVQSKFALRKTAQKLSKIIQQNI